jgi:hypothetical protein
VNSYTGGAVSNACRALHPRPLARGGGITADDLDGIALTRDHDNPLDDPARHSQRVYLLSTRKLSLLLPDALPPGIGHFLTSLALASDLL